MKDGTTLAIGAVAGLAGLALARAGSAAQGTKVSARLIAPAVSSVAELYAPKSPLVEISAPGGPRTLILADAILTGVYKEEGHCPLFYLSSEPPYADAKRELKRLARFVEWANTLSFPLAVYRGIGVSGEGEMDLRPDWAQAWSERQDVALRFLRQAMQGEDRSGRLLTGVVATPDEVDWAYTLDLFLAWSLFEDPEYEIALVNQRGSEAQPYGATLVRVQEVRPRPDLVERVSGARKPGSAPRPSTKDI